MNCSLIILIMLLIFQSISAQNVNYRTEIDTLESFEKRVLARLNVFNNEDLMEESTAYLYPVIHRVPRFKLTGNLIQKKIEMDSIVRHGTTKVFLESRLIRKAEFINGKEKYAIYYDQDGIEISKQEYLNTYKFLEPCGAIIGEFLITGRKKKK